jgi:FG-GAP-like repeat
MRSGAGTRISPQLCHPDRNRSYFNGDGKSDLAFCDNSGPVLRTGVTLGNGDGTFQRPVYYQIPFGPGNTFPFNFTAGDVNSDGKTDLIAVTEGGGTAMFAVLWGNGDGTFQKAKKITLPNNFGGEGGIVPGDFNSDGLLDFVLENDTGLGVYTQK